ncbi:MAG: hypothetical protein L0312_13705 [Acidobacteria bacterium]|nr:hypothetical protein [Acidobacteriota bacterium]
MFTMMVGKGDHLGFTLSQIPSLHQRHDGHQLLREPLKRFHPLRDAILLIGSYFLHDSGGNNNSGEQGW